MAETTTEFYHIEVDESLFNVDSDDEVRICKVAASFVPEKHSKLHVDAKANVLKAAKRHADLQRLIMSFVVPKDALLPEVLDIARTVFRHDNETFDQFETRLLEETRYKSLSVQVQELLDTVPTDKAISVVKPDKEVMQKSLKRRQVYKLEKHVQKLYDQLPKVIDGLEEFIVLRKDASRVVSMFNYVIDPANEQQENTILAMVQKLQDVMLKILEHKKSLLTVFASNYEASQSVNFLNTATRIANDLSPRLLVTLVETYPVLKSTSKFAEGITVEY